MRLAAFLFVAVPLAPGCAVNGLAFDNDNRVAITAPADNATVALPLTVEWTAQQVDGVYGIFFDKSPMRPNDGLLSLVDEDDPCRHEPTCPDATWLSDRGIYLTTKTSLTVESLPDLRASDSSADDRHDMTIVILDDEGRRVGESAFYREFIVERDD